MNTQHEGHMMLHRCQTQGQCNEIQVNFLHHFVSMVTTDQ